VRYLGDASFSPSVWVAPVVVEASPSGRHLPEPSHDGRTDARILDARQRVRRVSTRQELNRTIDHVLMPLANGTVNRRLRLGHPCASG
jgi:hypothetical protein